MMVTEECGVFGVGYEGREVAGFVADLAGRRVTRLVDVRLTPISRKRGFSKTALRDALAEVNITYDHRRELGNPKANRSAFAGPEVELEQAKAVYAELLIRDDAQRTRGCASGDASASADQFVRTMRTVTRRIP